MMPTVEEHRGEDLDQRAAEIFVDACHEAWRRRLAALFTRARDEHLNRQDLISREFEAQRIAFARCKNAATLRAAVTDFWARSGNSLAPLRTGWKDVLPFLHEDRWQEGRDLALLALASYRGATREERDALDAAAASDAANADEDSNEE